MESNGDAAAVVAVVASSRACSSAFQFMLTLRSAAARAALLELAGLALRAVEDLLPQRPQADEIQGETGPERLFVPVLGLQEQPARVAQALMPGHAGQERAIGPRELMGLAKRAEQLPRVVAVAPSSAQTQQPRGRPQPG